MIRGASLAVLNLVVTYGGSMVLRGLSLDVAPGECVAIVGPTGQVNRHFSTASRGQLRLPAARSRLAR